MADIKQTFACEMRLFFAAKDCGKPATLGWVAEGGARLVPVCEECRTMVGMNRAYLRPLASPAPPRAPTETRND